MTATQPDAPVSGAQWPRPPRDPAAGRPMFDESEKLSHAEPQRQRDQLVGKRRPGAAVTLPPPKNMITVVPADVAAILLIKAGLDCYRRSARGENPRVDAVLIAMTTAAIRWRESLTERGQKLAAAADIGRSSELLTTRQAAERARVSPRTITRAIAAGRLPAARAGRAWLVNRDDIDRYTRRMG